MKKQQVSTKSDPVDAKRSVKTAPKKKLAPKKSPAKCASKLSAPALEERLSPPQRRFVLEYIASLNATQAYMAAYPECTYGSARAASAVLLAKHNIQEAVRIERELMEERTKITADKVLKHWFDLATADASELIQYRKNNCRHCHGIGFEFQWIDRDEFAQATNKVLAHNAQEDAVKLKLPIDVGGFGFNPKGAPHQNCPKCLGEGIGEAVVSDTRHLSPQAKRLYAGVKITKDGLQVLMEDRGKALENVARHLGMFNDKLTIKGDAENPIALLLKQVGGSSLPVVPDDSSDD